MNKFYFKKWIMVMAVLAVSLNTPVFAKSKKGEEEKPVIHPEQLGKIALMIRGGSRISVKPKPKKDIWKDASTNFAVFGIGGVLGGALGSSVSKNADLLPASDKKAKKALSMEQELGEALGGWSYLDQFKEPFLQGLSPRYQITHLILCPSHEPAQTSQCTCYGKTEAGYESLPSCGMTMLIEQGTQTLADLKISAILMLADKLIPTFQAYADFIDLRQNAVLFSEGELNMGGIETKRAFESFSENNGALAKQHTEKAALAVANSLAAKLNAK